MRSQPQAYVLLVGAMLCQAVAFRPLFTSNFAWSSSSRSVVGSKTRLAVRALPTMGFTNPLSVLKQAVARAGAGVYDENAVKEAIDQYTTENKVMVFSWARCPFCKKAKGLLTDLLVDPSDYQFVELDERGDGNAIRYELSQMTGRTSVPHIWINGEFVGGCNDGPGVTTLMDRGELVPKLEAAGCRLK